MAIEQYTQINNRRGLQQDLPQLSSAELGWSVDTRRLFIGNGTLEEGAPEIGVTEILTEYSDIFSLAGAYTYKGAEAGYTVSTSGSPIFATASYANNSTTLSVTSSSGLRSGLLVIGVGIPTNTFIATSYTSGSLTVPITNATTANSVNSITGSTSIGVTFLSGIVLTQATWDSAAATVMLVPGTATAVQPGQLVTGPGIPSNTSVIAKSQLQTTTSSTNWGAGTTSITLASVNNNIRVGAQISGTGIPSNTIVTQVQGINLVISQATTAASMGTDLLTFTYFNITVDQNLGAAATGIAATFITDTARTLQEKLDDTVSVRDFGAVGDGVTDDTNAINQALNQLYCVQPYDTAEPAAPLVRRALLFPAGNYLVSSKIVIPPNATLYGEGMDHSIVFMSDSAAADDYVAITGDNYQQIGASIDTATAKNPATTVRPQNIYVRDMTFKNARALDGADIFVIDRAENVKLERVGIEGPETSNFRCGISINIPNINAAVYQDPALEFSVANPTKNITITGGRFKNLTAGIRDDSTRRNTEGDYASQCVTVTNNKFDNIRARAIHCSSDDYAWIILNNCFDTVALEGIRFDSPSSVTFQNAGQMITTGQNIFVNVGGGATPVTNCIYFYNKNCASIGDLFDRTNLQVINSGFQRVYLNTQTSIAFQGTSAISLAQRILNTSQTATISSNTAANIAVPGAQGSILDLTFTSRGANYLANDRPAVTFTGGGFATPASATTVIGFQLDRANSWITDDGNGWSGNINVSFSPPQIISAATIVSTQARWNTGSNVITNIANMAGIQPGGRIAAAGWPTTAVISSVDALANTVTANAQPASNAATATAINFNYGLYNQLGARAATGTMEVGYSVISVNISNIGAGYNSNIVNNIVYTAPDFANVAAANLTYSSANVFPNAVALGQSLNITSQIGANYDSAANITLQFPAPVTGAATVGYRRATANARWAGGVATVTLSQGGNFNANNTPTVVFSAPQIAEGTAATGNTVLGFPVSTVTINSNGSGYTSYPQASFVPNPVGNANAYSAAAQLYTQVISASVDNPGNTQGAGNGYAVNNIISLNDLGDVANVFSAANIQVTNIAASLKQLTIGNRGSGFTSLPVITIAAPNVGTNQAQAVSTANLGSVTVSQRGNGYQAGDILTIAQANNTGTNANITVASTRINSNQVAVNTSTILANAYFYDITADPNINIVGGAGTAARFRVDYVEMVLGDDFISGEGNNYQVGDVITFNIPGAGNTFANAIGTVIAVDSSSLSRTGSWSTANGAVINVNTTAGINIGQLIQSSDWPANTYVTAVYPGNSNVEVTASPLVNRTGNAIDFRIYANGVSNIAITNAGNFSTQATAASTTVEAAANIVLATGGSGDGNLNVYPAYILRANYFAPLGNGLTLLSQGNYTANPPTSNANSALAGARANITFNLAYEISTLGTLNAGNFTVNPLPTTTNFAPTSNSINGTGAQLNLDFGIATVSISNGGGGYLNNPQVSVTGGANANVEAEINNTGAVYAAVLTAAGNYGGYSNTQTNIFNTQAANGTGSNARVSVNMGLLSINLGNTGQGYISAPQVSVSGGGNGNITATLSTVNGIVRGVNVVTAGTGYTAAPTFVVTGGAANAVGTSALTANGNIFFTAVAPNFGGVGYTAADGNIAANITYTYNGSPVANLNVGGGIGARPVVAANTSNNSILAVTLNSGGNGYTKSANGNPTSARLIFAGANTTAATSQTQLGTTGSLGNFMIIDAGYGYTQLPSYNIITDGATGSNTVLGLSLEPRGNVFLASINPGSGYTSAPTVLIAPPGGVDFANRANAIANPPATQSEPLVIDTRFLTMSEMKYAVRISNATSIYTRSGTINITGGPIANISGVTTYIVESYDDYVQNYPINTANAQQQFLTVNNQPGNGIAYITYNNSFGNSVMADGSGYIRFYIDAIVDNN